MSTPFSNFFHVRPLPFQNGPIMSRLCAPDKKTAPANAGAAEGCQRVSSRFFWTHQSATCFATGWMAPSRKGTAKPAALTRPA